MTHKKELLRSLWVTGKGVVVSHLLTSRPRGELSFR